jgi:hypothetical protein
MSVIGLLYERTKYSKNAFFFIWQLLVLFCIFVCYTYVFCTYVCHFFYLTDDIKFILLYLAVVGPILRGFAGTAGHDYVQFRPELWLYFAWRPGAFCVCVDYWNMLNLGIVTAVVSILLLLLLLLLLFTLLGPVKKKYFAGPSIN